jgi:hypothetical protein
MTMFFFGDKVRAGPPLVGVFWEGTRPTCQSMDFVAKKKTLVYEENYEPMTKPCNGKKGAEVEKHMASMLVKRLHIC